MAKAKKDTSERDLVARVRRRAKVMFEADEENRKKALEDLRFLHVPGEQWDPLVKGERGNLRPIYEFNKLRITCKRIVNDMRANRPQGKVRAVEDGDKSTANVLEGLIRNIWNVSDGDTVIDQAAEYQVGAGMGAWRVVTEYADDEAFDQSICIKPIRNPFCLYADPSAQDMLKRDAMDWVLTDKISKASFETRWPGVEPVSFDDDTAFDDDEDWQTEEQVRIAEYWWKEPVERTLCLLSNGATVDADSEDGKAYEAAGLTKIKERRVKAHKIMMCIMGGGDKLLEKPTEWAGKEFPFVLIYGETLVLEGKTSWFGLTRFGKDAQRAYNYSRTNAIESVALAPQAKYWATANQAKGLTDQWAVAHKTNMPFQLYNPDPQSPGPPQRMGGADVPVALIQEMQNSSEDIKAVTGIYDASLGAQGNETSGKAINARQRQGEIATFNYMDNMAKGIRRTWEIMIDLVPKIYDTERSVRILGHDGAEDYAKVNAMDPNGNAINDLNSGKYDVTVTVGPSFATLRQEAAEAYGEIAARDPNVMMAAGDLVFKAMDLPYAEQIAERYRALLPPPIQEMLTKGKQLPPEVQAAMGQIQQMSQMIDEKGKLVQAAEMELKELQASAQSDKAGAQLASANLKTQEAQFAALQKDLDFKREALDEQKAMLAIATENALLKIKLAHSQAEHSLTETAHHHEAQVTQDQHDLENKERDVNETVKDASHNLEKQAVSIDVKNMQAAHKQDLKAAKTPKPKKG